MIAVYALISPLHDKAVVSAATREFLESLGTAFDYKGEVFDDYGLTFSLIYVGTGGTEGRFKQLLPVLRSRTRQPFFLLTSGKSNSLAASMEILSYLRAHGIPGEIFHGGASYIRSRIETAARTWKARRVLEGTTLGVIGAPSDWLIASDVDREAVLSRLGIHLQYIPMEALLEAYASLQDETGAPWDEVVRRSGARTPVPAAVKQALPGAWRLYRAFRTLVSEYDLSGLTVRCFDLLTSVRNTGCLALARLNAEGLAAGCEGDIPALLSMMVGRAATGVSGFQANPSAIDPQTGEVAFAHCTVPLDMVSSFGLDTHFESGIGVGIRGTLPEGPVTVFKVSGDLSRHVAFEGELLRNEARPDRCRTQVVVKLSPGACDRFLTDPVGNHHILLPGHCAGTLEALLK